MKQKLPIQMLTTSADTALDAIQRLGHKADYILELHQEPTTTNCTQFYYKVEVEVDFGTAEKRPIIARGLAFGLDEVADLQDLTAAIAKAFVGKTTLNRVTIKQTLAVIFDAYNLWGRLVLVRAWTKAKPRKQPKPKPIGGELTRVGSRYAGALLHARKAEDNMPLPLSTTLFLLTLNKLADIHNETNTGNLFAPATNKEMTVTITPKMLARLAEDLHGERGDKYKQLVLRDIQTAMTTIKTVVTERVEEEVPTSKRKGKFARVEKITRTKESTGVLITCREKETIEANLADGAKLTTMGNITLTLSKIYAYWVKSLYRKVDIGELVKRTRETNGTAFLQLQLWAAEIFPNIKMAKKAGKPYSATFYFADVERPKSEEGPTPKKDLMANSSARKSLVEVADEVAAAIEADKWQIAEEKGKKVGLSFFWI